MWYPQNKKELDEDLERFLNQKINQKPENIHGLIVPHAGYEFSGRIAGKAFSLLRDKKIRRAIIMGPSHYIPLHGIVTSGKKQWETPLGKIKLFNSGFEEKNIEKEHSITNQIPFLQKLNIREVLPLMTGEITDEQAAEIAQKISKIPAVYIFSTDLSHFFPYETASKKDRQTTKIIENLDLKNSSNIDACGIYPLLIMMHLCKIKNWKPKLIGYKNSGDITESKSSVVGYASFYF